jgi:hypothetical protein
MGNPPDGLPLHAAMVAFDGRAFLRLAAGQSAHGGYLRRRAVRYVENLSRLRAIFFELASGTFAASQLSDPDRATEWHRVAARQLRALSLLPKDRRFAQKALRSPRAPGVLLAMAPRSVRALLVEQLVFAMLLARRWNQSARSLVLEGALSVGIGLRTLESIESRSAAFLMAHEQAALAL